MKANQRYVNSIKLWEKAKASVIPGSSTISKRADLYPFGAFPIYLDKASGADVWDIDGNQYIDFQSALGAIILGANHPSVTRAMSAQLTLGSLFSLSHPSVLQLADKLIKHIPCAEKIRVLKNGSDATTGAARIARAYTGRDIILACHYHGWHDWYYVSTTMNAGIPRRFKDNIVTFPYGDLEAFKVLLAQYKNKVAGVMMEVTHLQQPPVGYLEALKKLIHEAGAVLIFDEVVTGFRFGLGGAQSYFNVIPDIACFAKALGNGASMAAIAGKNKIMNATQAVVTTQTYGEDCLAIAAAIATLEVMENEPVVETIWKRGSYLQTGYHALAQQYGVETQCVGYPVRLQIEFADRGNISGKLLKNYLLQETAKDGFLIAHMIFINYAHTEAHIDRLLHSIEKVFQTISQSSDAIQLDGMMANDLW